MKNKENNSLKSAGLEFQKYLEGVEIMRGNVVTLNINGGRLDAYLEAGAKSGFTVKKIADEGEEYFSLSKEPPTEKERILKRIKVTQKGHIAISIKKPEGSTGDHTPFWRELENLNAKRI